MRDRSRSTLLDFPDLLGFRGQTSRRYVRTRGGMLPPRDQSSSNGIDNPVASGINKTKSKSCFSRNNLSIIDRSVKFGPTMVDSRIY